MDEEKVKDEQNPAFDKTSFYKMTDEWFNLREMTDKGLENPSDFSKNQMNDSEVKIDSNPSFLEEKEKNEEMKRKEISLDKVEKESIFVRIGRWFYEHIPEIISTVFYGTVNLFGRTFRTLAFGKPDADKSYFEEFKNWMKAKQLKKTGRQVEEKSRNFFPEKTERNFQSDNTREEENDHLKNMVTIKTEELGENFKEEHPIDLKNANILLSAMGFVLAENEEHFSIAKIEKGKMIGKAFDLDENSFGGKDNNISSLATALFQMSTDKKINQLSLSDLDQEMMKSFIKASIIFLTISSRENMVSEIPTSMGKIQNQVSCVNNEKGELESFCINLEGKNSQIPISELNSESDLLNEIEQVVCDYCKNPPLQTFSIVEREGKQVDVSFKRGNPEFHVCVRIDGEEIHKGTYKAEESPASKKEKKGEIPSIAALRRDLSDNKDSPAAKWSKWDKNIDHYTWLHASSVAYTIGAIVNPQMCAKEGTTPQTKGQQYSILTPNIKGNPSYLESTQAHLQIHCKEGNPCIVSNIDAIQPIELHRNNATEIALQVEKASREIRLVGEKSSFPELEQETEEQWKESFIESVLEQAKESENQMEIKDKMNVNLKELESSFFAMEESDSVNRETIQNEELNELADNREVDYQDFDEYTIE